MQYRNLKLGTQLRLVDGNYLLAGAAKNTVKLRNADTGEYTVMSLGELALALEEPVDLAANTRREVDELQYLPAARRKDIELLAVHLEEMMNGTPLPGGEPQPEYDPVLTSASSRTRAKVMELQALGMKVSERSIDRKKALYKKHGAAGLVDARETRRSIPLSGMDGRVREALIVVMAGRKDGSTVSLATIRSKLAAELLRRFPGEAVELPSKTTLWRYVTELGAGTYVTGNAANRRSKANAPKKMFDSRPKIMPGHEIQIDSSPFDIIVLDDGGNPVRANLTIMIDACTRSIIASSVTLGGTRGIDHAFLLAQALVPAELRPGGEHYAKYELPIMPWAKLLTDEEAAGYDTSRPFIAPQRIITDNGADYVSSVFRNACIQLEIDITESSTYTPTDKAIVERTFKSIRTLFAMNLPGYTGGTVTDRGKNPGADEGLLNIWELTELFDRWVSIVWQNRPHDGLQDPLDPSIIHTPNSMYMASFDITGFIPMPLTAREYIALMPIHYRTIQADGITIDYRRYDSALLQDYRLADSGDSKNNGKWAVKYHPNDPSAVWVKDPETQEWIECLWMNGDAFARPFSRRVRSEARRITAELGVADDPDRLKQTLEILGTTRQAQTQAKAEEQRRALAAKNAPSAFMRRNETIEPPARSTESQDNESDTQAAAANHFVDLAMFNADRRVF
jgi:putative transposase